MNEKEYLLSDISLRLNKKGIWGYEISLKDFTETLLEVMPDICYEEYCILTKEFFDKYFWKNEQFGVNLRYKIDKRVN